MLPLPQKIGIIAGRGRLPVLIAEEIRKKSPSTRISALCFKGESGREMKSVSDEVFFVEVGHLGSIIEYFRKNGIEKAAMAGLLRHKLIFDKNVKLDEMTSEMFGNIGDLKADSILGGVARKLSEHGIELIGMTDILDAHMAPKGLLTSTPPAAGESADIEFGFGIAKEISRLDTGQSVVVKKKCVVAIESIEGTDLCILRGGRLAGPGAVVVKVAKLHQDLRFDIPVIGMKTLKTMRNVKSNTIAVEAGKTCIIDKNEVIDKANRYGISIAGI
jgi:hypothetical protein